MSVKVISPVLVLTEQACRATQQHTRMGFRRSGWTTGTLGLASTRAVRDTVAEAQNQWEMDIEDALWQNRLAER